jgi:hypothetical protein
MTSKFKGTSFLDNTPQLKTIFFQGKSAKDFLLESLVDEKSLERVRATPTWGLEPRVIWVLSKHFNVFSLEKRGALLATLIEDLDYEVRKYMMTLEETGEKVNKGEKGSGETKDCKKRARGLNQPESLDERKDDGQSVVDREPPITRDNIHGSKRKEPKKRKQPREQKADQLFAIGRILLNWLLNKELVCIYQADVDIKMGEKDRYLQKPSYVRCLFDIKLLPLNVTLPMVHPPLEWKIRRPKRSDPDQADQKIRLGDLTGGYLYSDPKLGDGHSKGASALSTHDETKFDIHLHGDAETRQLTRVLNKLQGVPFQINGLFLDKLRDDWDHLQKFGLVMPKILDSIDRREGLCRLHEHFMKDDDIQDNFTYRQLSKVLLKNIQEANYEQYILLLAEAYKGYFMYFPSFMDFRGRNYRYGPFHLHERDLVRSLIVFGDPGEGGESEEDMKVITTNHIKAAAFHFTRKFWNYSTALTYFNFKDQCFDKLVSPDKN